MKISEITSLAIAITVILSFAWNVYQAGKSHDYRLDNYDENLQKELKTIGQHLGELSAQVAGNQSKIKLLFEHILLNKSIEKMDD